MSDAPRANEGRLKRLVRWGALWHSENRLDGVREHLCCENCLPVLFVTRRECRAWIVDRYGYIKTRRDLRAEPHGWRMPRPVRVTITPNKGVTGDAVGGVQ